MKNVHTTCIRFLLLFLLSISLTTFGHGKCESSLLLHPNFSHDRSIINHNHTQLSDTIPEGEQANNIIAGQSQPKLISDQFSFTEGPAVDKQGNIFFTDQPNNKIWKYSTDGKLSVFLEEAGRANGLFFDKKGNLIACADEHNQLWSISPKGKVTVLVEDFQGQQLNGPNDLWVDPKGGIYFTDPYYQRSYWERQSPDPDLGGEKVYYLPKGKKEPVLVADNLLQPNGIIGTPDGKYLYVADIKDKKTYKYSINKDGTLQERELFVDQGSDGMTIDNQGNIYLTGDGVTVYNPEGKKIEHIAIPSKWTANVCLGGKDKNKLFITATDSIYILDMQVKGVQ